jgi:hypothetical protein
LKERHPGPIVETHQAEIKGSERAGQKTRPRGVRSGSGPFFQGRHERLDPGDQCFEPAENGHVPLQERGVLAL